MLKIIELTKECNQMRNEDTAHMTQSWWKQISQTNTCQWYSPSTWPDTSWFCSVWQYFSVSLNVIPHKCPAGSWTQTARDLSNMWWAQQGHLCSCQDDARFAHLQPFSQTIKVLAHLHGLFHHKNVETNRNPHVSYKKSSLHEAKVMFRVNFKTPVTEGKEQNPIIAITEIS